MEDTALAGLPGSMPVCRPLLTWAGLLYHLGGSHSRAQFSATVANHTLAHAEDTVLSQVIAWHGAGRPRGGIQEPGSFQEAPSNST